LWRPPAQLVTSVVTGNVFRSQSGQKCVGGRSSAPDPAEELTALPRSLTGLWGRRGKGRRKGRDGRTWGRTGDEGW